MSYFEVTVQAKGKKLKHGVHADSKEEALQIAKVKYRGIVIRAVPATIPFEEQLQQTWKNIKESVVKKKITQDALIAAVTQLAVMTNAGLSIHDSLSDIADSTADEKLKEILGNIAENIDSGRSLADAAEEYRYEFGNLTIAMIQLGEQTGNLSEALYTLAEMLEEVRNNIKKFKKAMAYPRNVMVAMAIAFSILLTYVVPKFERIFNKLGADLPIPTLILMTLSDFLRNYGLEIILGVIIFVFVFKYLVKNSDNFRYKYHQFILKTKIIKDIAFYSTISRFMLVFTELIRAGIPIAEALDTTIEMVDNMVLQRKLQTVRNDISKGMSLVEAFERTGLLENMILQMVKAGEAGGQLDTMLGKVSDYYKMKFDAVIDTLQEAIEPIMLFIIAAMVILLALGIFMPMWDIGNAAKKGR
jgi:general secretion pathway protein F